MSELPETSPPEEAVDPRDDAILRDTTYATQSLVAGLIGLVLSPIVLGFLPAAIGLHAGMTHLRFRTGARLMAGVGLATSGLGAIVAAASAIVWGGALLSVLLQKSAIDQARQWAGITPAPWSATATDGTTFDAGSLRGRLVFIDVCSPHSPYSRGATDALGTFALRHPDVVAFSWCPECTEADANAYLQTVRSEMPIVAGLQSMTEPLTLIPATPTLVVIDEAGALRLVTPGTYGERELLAVMAAPTPKARGLLGRPQSGGSRDPATDAPPSGRSE